VECTERRDAWVDSAGSAPRRAPATKGVAAKADHIFTPPTRSSALALAVLMGMGIVCGYAALHDHDELARLGELQRDEEQIIEHNQARNLLIQQLAKDRGGKIAHLRGYAEEIDGLAKSEDRPAAVVIFTPADSNAKPEVAALPDLRRRIETQLHQMESWSPPPLLASHADMRFSAAELHGSRVPAAAMLVAAIVSLALWSTISLRNLPALRADCAVSPSRAAVSWLAPPANFYLPFVIMRDLWQGSDPTSLANPQRLRLPVISMWWLGWLAAGCGFAYATWRMFAAKGIFSMTESTRIAMYADAGLAAAALVTFVIVAATTWNQSRRIGLVENLEAQIGPRATFRPA